MKSLLTPAIPNSPLTSITDKQQFGELRLRRNNELHFIENAAFEPSLATYDENYQNSQAHSKVFLQHMQDVLMLLKQQVSEGSLIVEVGCGKGDFIELIQKDGYFEVRGFDATYDGTNPVIEKRYLTSDDSAMFWNMSKRRTNFWRCSRMFFEKPRFTSRSQPMIGLQKIRHFLTSRTNM